MRAARETPSDTSSPSDEELVRALVDDPTAVGPIYDRYGGLVYGLALRIVGNPAEAEDLTQEVFLALCRQSVAYDPARGAVGALLTTMVRSRAIDRLRHRTRSTRVLRMERHETALLEPAASPLERVSLSECSERVRSALAELPDTERRALEMAYYQGLTQGEIASELGAPLGTVKSWCRRGLLQLKGALADLAE